MQLTFIDRSEQRYVVGADRGMSVMQAAVENLVPGILGDCGGACACACAEGGSRRGLPTAPTISE